MTDPTTGCLFCRIIRGEIPSKKVHEDEHVYAFEDLHPQAPTHVLIIPKKHFAGLKEAQAEDAEVIGRCHLAAAEIARKRNIEQSYRTVLNVGPGAGQSVFPGSDRRGWYGIGLSRPRPAFPKCDQAGSC